MPRLFAPLMVLLHSLSGKQTGIYFADSTKFAVCHNCGIRRHKVFEDLAARGKTSMCSEPISSAARREIIGGSGP